MAQSNRESRIRSILLILLACFACYQLGIPLIRRGRVSPADIRTNEISRLDRVFDKIKPDLDDPDTIGVITNEGVRELYLAQFCLAPRIVVGDSILDRTVALYKDIDSLTLDSLTDQGFRRIDTVNSYLVLFRKAP